MDVSLLDNPVKQAVQPNLPLADREFSGAQRAHRRRTLFIFLGVWIISAFYVAVNLNRGWVPHDEGTYAQAAERVLHGQLPHRDFDDHYTGGMSFLNAFAFSVLGTNLMSLRLILFLFFLAWVPAIFYIAKQFASDAAAGAIALLAVAWSIPNYSAAVPSWYNLTFALLGTVAILKYLETRTPWWLFLAGLCGGLSILIKITGVYFVIAALLFFVFREQCDSEDNRERIAGGGRIYSLFVTAGLLSFVAFLSSMIRSFRGGTYIVHFILPSASLVVFLLLREFRIPTGNASRRFLSLFRMVGPFAIGITLPIVVYLIPYIRSRSIPALIRGVFVLPQLHLTYTVVGPVSLSALPPTLLLAGLIAVAAYLQGTLRTVFGALVFLTCGAALVASGHSETIYRLIWHSLSFSIPLLVVSVVALLYWGRNAGKMPGQFRERLMLLACLTAVWSLVQIPFSAPIYFCFVAPVLALTVLAFFSAIPKAPKFVLGTLVCFYLLFAVLRMTPGFIYRLGYSADIDRQTMLFDLPRVGGLRINTEDALLYEQLIPLIQTHAKGDYLYAAPDCPEVYFLSGLRNPTHTLFDYFDEADEHTERILDTIAQNRINVVAVLKKPPFSPPLAPDLHAALVERFPNSSTVGRFEVRWRQ